MEVRVRGVWGLVCPSDLSRWREEGRVVCRSLQKKYFKSVGTAFPTGYNGVRYSGQLGALAARPTLKTATSNSHLAPAAML